MTKKRNTKVPITVYPKIKDLAEQILDPEDVISLFAEIDEISRNNCNNGETYIKLFHQWLIKRYFVFIRDNQEEEEQTVFKKDKPTRTKEHSLTKKKNTKVPITVCIKIKDLAELIYQLEVDEILCLFKEVDALCSDDSICPEITVEWNTAIEQWFNERSAEAAAL